MMRTLNLSGFKPSDSLSVSVSQNALTAGPINVPSWGTVGTGGIITINVHRANLHVAPSSVRFSVDLSLSDFDTPGPTGDETYDARLHDLIYLWDFDDPGTWTAPVQNLAAHKNRNAGKGPIEANMYRTPGTYNPSVLVIEPSTGKTATASVSVTVTDPDVVFAGTKTICINPVGDSDFAGAPAGSVNLQVDLLVSGHTAWANQMSETEVKRWLFKGGVTHATNLYLGQYAEAGAYFGSYGSGRAILRTERRESISLLLYDNHCFTGIVHQQLRGAEYWYVDLEGAGNFDPTTGLTTNMAGYDHTFLRHYDDGCVTMSNCYLHNFKGSTVLMNPPTKARFDGNYGSESQVLHMDDCVIQNFGGNQYVLFQVWESTSPASDTWFVASGLRVEQDPEAWDGELIRAPIRINDSRRHIVKGCDIFHTESRQPAVKLAETPMHHGVIANCHSNALESSYYVVRVNGNKIQSLSGGIMQVNAIIDSNVLCGMHSSLGGIVSWGTGVTIRNNLIYIPDGKSFVWPFNQCIELWGPDPWTGFPPTYPEHILAAPVKIYNNTLRCDRTQANNSHGYPGDILFITEVNPGKYPVVAHNNVVHMPYTRTVVVEFAPVSDTVLFTPRSTGWVNAWGWNGEPVPTAHPDAASLTSVKDTKPLPGSAALGAALSGDVSYMDLTGTTRTAPADKGAWEAA